MSFFNHLKFDEGPETPDLSGEQASRLLSIGMRGPKRPVDVLLEYLGRGAGHEWFERALDAAMRSTTSRPGESLLDGSATMEELRVAKAAAKQAMQQAVESGDDAAGAVALYFTATAAALAHHGERITSQSDDDLISALADLADAAPPAWRPLFDQSLSS